MIFRTHSPTTPEATMKDRPDHLLSRFLDRNREIFRSIAFPTDVWRADPCDVETIHAEAREQFDRLLRTAADGDSPNGRILLLRGESGSGKTHLMRAFRTRTHGRGDGYFGYMQMTTASSYGPYILRKLIESLDRPYSPYEYGSEETGLIRLSTAVAESAAIPRARLELLREGELDADEMSNVVAELADAALQDPQLASMQLDLVRVLLFLQTGDPAIHSRALKYLRCEDLSQSDRNRLCGVTPLTGENDAVDMICRLGTVMARMQQASLVICVDQLEDIFRAYDEGRMSAMRDMFRRAVVTLRAISDQLPSSIIVISCLEDYYNHFREALDTTQLDRIEHNPAPINLVAQRTRDEIELLVRRHLAQLLDANDGDLESHWPLPDSLLDALAGRTTRNVLQACKDFRERCIAAGRIVSADAGEAVPATPSVPPDLELTDLEQLWNDFSADWTKSPPEEEEALARLLQSAIDLVSLELPNRSFETRRTGRLVTVRPGEPGAASSRLVGVCNRSWRGGGLTRQVTELLESAEREGCVPIIVRSTEYKPKQPGSQIAQRYAEVNQRGGEAVTVEDSDWRRFEAMLAFRERHGALAAFPRWLEQMQPLGRVTALQRILDLTSPEATASAADAQASAPSDEEGAAQSDDSAAARDEAPRASRVAREPELPAEDPTRVTIGYRRTDGSPIVLDRNAYTRHAAFLGGTGSGKTTAALNVIEQLLLGGIPAVLIDRKGDLASYAQQSVLAAPCDEPALEPRRRRLRESISVRLYTPGRSDGCPLSLSVVPDGAGELSHAELQNIARGAAESLGSMLNYGKSPQAQARISVIIKAVEILAQRGVQITLPVLFEYIAEPDEILVTELGRLPSKHREKVVEDLQMLHINQQPLFAQEGDPLNGDLLFGRGRWAEPGRTRLSIISTKFLGDTTNIQFWVAQLLLELHRWLNKNPASGLQAVVMLDEADMYLPASSRPATKEPLESLLRRARSAGLGVFLATQSPGDLDYRARDNIGTWMLGRIQQARAIEKLRPLLADLGADVADELAGQTTGEFFLAHAGNTAGIKSMRSAVLAEQLADHEILETARINCAPQP